MKSGERSIASRRDSGAESGTRAGYTRRAMDEHEHEHEHEEAVERSEEEELERTARRLVALSRIRQYGDPVLRMKGREVEDYDDDLERLVERMTRLVREAQGVGLAATQVGVVRRLFVFVHDGEDRLLVNPVITKRSKETSTDEEGCLSLQGVLVPVERSVEVTIEGFDVSGEPLLYEFEEPTSRIVQHELDHLDGVLIIDRTNAESRRAALAKLRPQPVLGAR
jgi:peptide deformylase